MADTIERLKELKEMLDGGLITQAEFDDLKARELGADISAYNGFDKGQQNDSVFVNQGVVHNNNKKRGKGCLTTLLVFVGVIVLIIVGVLAADAGYDKKNNIEQERVDALEQIVDVEKYYHMSEEEFFELHGEPEIELKGDGASMFNYGGDLAYVIKDDKCVMVLYKVGFELEKVEDVFILFGIAPNDITMQIKWIEDENAHYFKDVNEYISYMAVYVDEDNPKRASSMVLYFR